MGILGRVRQEVQRLGDETRPTTMLGAAWRLSKGYRLCPWRSPYLRWRIETYQGWHADRITAGDFWRFVWTNRRELVRFLRWADRMHSGVRAR